VIFFCTTTFVSFGQTNKWTTYLLDSAFLTKNTRTIVLIETDTFLVLTTYELFVENCESVIKKYNVNWDIDLLKLFIVDNSKIIYADSLTKTDINKSRIAFRIASLIENGQCLVYNKQKMLLEKSLIIENYEGFDVSGRRMKTKDNHLILETIDSVY
jgi:hypothetical protein